MEKLARLIEERRRKAGMLHLDLPEVQLVLDPAGKVIDAVPEDAAYSHTVIEMFMVEANEAVAELFSRQNRPCLRRIHPDPAGEDVKQLSTFLRACGHRIATGLSHRDLQGLLEGVKGRPESYAINLAILRTFEQAEYSPMLVGHFALASRNYCHFTSPIRRYPDLTIHRLLGEYNRGRLADRPPEDMSALTRLGQHCSACERRSQAAETELRQVLVLQLMQTKIGETFDGVVTGVAGFGIFVQLRRLLIEGLIRLEELGDDWWEVDARAGSVRGQMSGRRVRIGDLMNVTVAGVDVARRQLNLVPAREQGKGQGAKPPAQARKKRK
jgi:ribonuclease R